jgi:hypothetical protein
MQPTKCAICHKAKDEHVRGISGVLGCHNNSSSTTYEPETKQMAKQVSVAALLDEKVRKPLDKTEALAIARGLKRSTDPALIQRLAIDACKAHGWS